jgi:hypothetical protein
MKLTLFVLLLCLCFLSVTYAQVEDLEEEGLDITDVLEQNIESIEDLLNVEVQEGKKKIEKLKFQRKSFMGQKNQIFL